MATSLGGGSGVLRLVLPQPLVTRKAGGHGGYPGS